METILGFEDFFDNNFKEFADDSMVSASAQSIGALLCDKKTVEDLTIKGTAVSGLAPAEDTDLYAGPHEDTPVQMYDFTVQQKKWTQAVVIPKAVWKFAKSKEYLVDKYRQEGQLSAIGESFADRLDTDVSYYINNSTSATISPTPDGVALASASHPVNPDLSTTYNSNYNSGSALTVDTTATMLNLIAKCSNYRNQPANLHLKNPIYLLAPTDMQKTARGICQTLGMEWGTANNNQNVFPAMGLQQNPLIWPRLSTRYDSGAGSVTACYLVIPKLTFCIYESQPVVYRSWVDTRTEAYTFMAESWFRIAIKDFRGVWKY